MSASKAGSSPSLLDVGSLSKGGSTGGKEKDNEETVERQASPDQVKCAICLGDVVNRSRSNNCSHQFCFGCLLEWSKVKPECPLCKSSFRSIYHNFRSSSEYDEYTVPVAAVPHLSIRLTASAGGNYRLSPFIRVLEARHAQLSPLSHLGHHGQEGVSLASIFQPPPPSTLLMGGNPFNSASSSGSLRAEYFGDILTNELRNQEDATQMRGYQNRRRRYDRNEWVQPFGSTLQPGSVIFPSVEYIRSHPSAAGRLRSWLYRELNVLMGIHRNRDQLGFIYDLIIHLLSHYDIRSRDFRDSISSYMGARTSHFQHELYHFLLSGMGMEEYDRVAEYPSASTSCSRMTVSGSTTSQQPLPQRNAPPEVITLDSDDEERNSNSRRSMLLSRRQGERMDDVIVVESSSSDEDESPLLRPLRGGSESNGASRSFDIVSVHENSADDSSTRGISSNSPVPDLSISSEQGDNESVIPTRRRFASNGIDLALDPDPEMPVLERQVFSFVPLLGNYTTTTGSNVNTVSGRSRGNTATAIDRSRATAATTTVSTRNLSSPTLPSPEHNQHVSRNRRDSSSERPSYMDTEFDLDLDVSVEQYTTPPPTEPSRPLRSPDFPILQFREFRHNFLRDRDRIRSSEFRRDFMSTFMSNRPSSSRTAEGGSAFVAYEPDTATAYPSSSREEPCRPPRPSCSYDNDCSSNLASYQRLPSSTRAGRYRTTSPSPAFRIDLYPHGMSSSQVMDLSRSAGLIAPNSSSSRTLSSASLAERTVRSLCPPPHSPLPLNLAAGTSSKKEETTEVSASVADSDELECLGSFPIQKKPPLAVITLSSDDEDDSRIKSEKKDDILSILSSDDEAALLDGFMNWGSHSGLPPPEFNLLGTPSPPLPENDIYCGSDSSSSPDFLHEEPIPVASSSRMAVQNSAEASTSNHVTRSKSLMESVLNSVWQPEGIKRKSDPINDFTKSKKRNNCYQLSSSTNSPPKKRSKRLQISSSSEDSGNDDNDNRDTHSSSSPSVAHKSSKSRVRIPKKRMFVEIPSTPSPPSPSLSSSEDSEISSHDEDDLETTSSSKGSKRRCVLPTKKHKLKSKKSKKSKKHKSKQRKRRSRSESGSSKCDKSKTSGISKAATDCTSRKGVSNINPKHSSGIKSKEGNHPSTSNSSSKSTGGLLDLSFSSRNDDAIPSLLRHDEAANTFDVRIPPFPDPVPSSSLSTVDASAIFDPTWFM